MLRLLSLVILYSFTINAQQMRNEATANSILGSEGVPKETVLVHYNSTVLLPGETLYYKVYCLDKISFKTSKFSKIAYIALIDESKHYVFKHKIELKEGVGYGDFFIPVDVPSGNYKILAYTRWMLNNNDFDIVDVHIINPYQNNYSEQNRSLESRSKDLLIEKIKTLPLCKKIVLNKKHYGKREQVVLNLGKWIKKNELGNYSLSVFKKYSFNQPEFDHFINKKVVKTSEFSDISEVQSDYNYLPEIRGELISGKIKSKDSFDFRKEIEIGISLISSNQTRIITPDDSGNFSFNSFRSTNGSSDLFIQIMNGHIGDFEVVLDSFPKPNINSIKFSDLEIEQHMKEAILQRSIYNQIENNYYTIKPDSIVEREVDVPFYGEKGVYTYNLDDFTRFETVKETLVEIIDGVWSRKDDKGLESFVIRGLYQNQEEIGYKPLLLIDGIIEQNHDRIINSKANRIKSISYIRDIYYLGLKVYGGIVIIRTKENNYSDFLDSQRIKKIQLSAIQNGSKKYFKYNYDSNNYDRIPDYRHQLLWLPNIKISDNNEKIFFFTSDVEGEFVVSLEGLTTDGEPISMKQSFWVQ